MKEYNELHDDEMIEKLNRIDFISNFVIYKKSKYKDNKKILNKMIKKIKKNGIGSVLKDDEE